ncbi:MAG: fumarylacetoacetate hydrolase family protein [Rhodospirillaceae bacterium]|jgi:fumarylacetoacetate (FAA) hydrolase family protein|nr:fumarylacetoacetate hydrolase family protein [Rhodospirillaceae bacterium]
MIDSPQVPNILPADYQNSTLVGRVYRPGLGASVIVIRDNFVFDITDTIATLSDLFNQTDPLALVQWADGEKVGALETLVGSSLERLDNKKATLLMAPSDLQPIKACGVTFASSMIERVIDERTGGDPGRADQIRDEIVTAVGVDLSKIKPGSDAAQKAKEVLKSRGLWSQYLEVGIGPDAEIFTKASPMASVGYGAEVGLHPISQWNNPEPEIVLAINGRGQAVGATLGNDVNLRDVEGRSALLLGKAKDNNASSAIGPFIRLFDDSFTMDDVRNAVVHLRVEGEDGFVLDGKSSMAEISRDPEELIDHAYGDHHQYPDGFMLFLGTLFSPIQDRDVEGSGFTHKLGDKVIIHSDRFGTLVNHVALSTEISPWTYGLGALFHDLARRNDRQ